MPARRLLMRKIREILRLRHEQGLSHREIARACVIGAGTDRYLQKTAERGLGWPLPAELDDTTLEARLFRRPAPAAGRARPCAHMTASSSATRHRCSCSGRSTSRSIRTATATRVLRDLPAVGQAAAAVDAAGAPRRREDLHRLLRQAAEPGRPAHGGAAACRAVCRRARRQPPHLRRGDRDPAVG